MKKSCAVALAVAGVMSPYIAFGQSAPSPERPDPLDSKASVPTLRYESAIRNYRPMDDKTTSAKAWRSANDLVRDTGGMTNMDMGGESGDMSGMSQGAMKGMDKGGMSMKKSRPKPGQPAKQSPAQQDSMPGMDMSSGMHNKNDKEKP